MKKIAIIGSGISGLSCAHLLHKQYDVTVFEKNDYIGGHTATVDVDIEGTNYAIDTGFIVFNDRTYPYFEKLLSRIGISRKPTQMSFSVHNEQTGFEYNGHTFTSLFAQKRNILRPRFYKLLADIVRFNKLCKSLHSKNVYEKKTLGQLLDEHSFNDFFRYHYILPMGAAIWSTSIKEMSNVEVEFFVKFFFNHGLLDITNRPQWYVIPGGSREYIAPLINGFEQQIKLNSDIAEVERLDDKIIIHLKNGEQQQFDKVVFACHSDQALGLLSSPSIDEKRVLGAIPYSENSVILHTDTSILPKRKAAWASWNYLLNDSTDKAAVVTYQMNILQGIQSDTQFCVTLNHKQGIDKSKILREFTYHHPVFNEASIAAQQQKHSIDGENNTYFCGAYWYNGFHEDGVRSAVDVARQLGVEFE
ncbi:MULTISPECIES: FAD-dependent oxidoreductase [unclassified Pseudoalteromonas]|uniref:NAD(P)/FAD-dependent oxidoreductase n=1 Tax=unclassified Pseudoalteromonas TaxID=194690 RepID=UPI000C089DB0|nr:MULTISPECIES: FAD-dependent oxidoreductase [unclassified Pseudoalteromonas]MDP2633165.1 FAD-dependent oxidoreductase [Pseudoalteromonas sp. 1_MG-2023]PHN91856.1 FAD-dependent oxidoreductase [Pseudoalteromonas sp. 3D05]